MSLSLDSTIEDLQGFGSVQSQLFAKLDILTIRDLLLYRPRTFWDFSHVSPISSLEPGQVTVKARVLSVKGQYLRRGLHRTEALIEDDSGAVVVSWFNQPYRSHSLSKDSWYYFFGNYDLRNKRLQILNPSTEKINDDQSQNSLLKPVYATTKGLKNIQIQRALKQALPLLSDLPDVLPSWMLAEAQLESLADCFHKIHAPKHLDETQAALEALELRDLVALSLSSQLLKQRLSQQKAEPLPVNTTKVETVINKLPFTLTQQQQALVKNILDEMAIGQYPLNRLIQGDVGSGKTIIALLIACNLMESGYQVALLAPTQILADQHFQTAKQILQNFYQESEITLLTAAATAAQKNNLYQDLATGKIKLVIGTQALLNRSVEFKRLALTIIDEQHRFGVNQRSQLLKKTKPQYSNILSLSATPIPRSLALVVYAELDISLLSEKPAGSLPVITEIIPLQQRAIKLKEILMTASKQQQAYIVCPRLEDVDEQDSLKKIKEYVLKIIPKLDCQVLHGRLDSSTKEQVMRDFSQGKFAVLFCTSIVEAGLDVPAAKTMIIMSPDRFGLAQLHQIRGRVGRRQQQGFCYLFPFSNQAPSERMQTFLKYNDGFKLSEIDLKLRGPGTLYGLKQSGSFALFKTGLQKPQLFQHAMSLATQFIERGESLDQYPQLAQQVETYQQVTYLN